MKKLIYRARDEFKRMADQMDSALKGLAGKADSAAKALAKIVKGVLDGQHRP
jgi:hypothetical protein